MFSNVEREELIRIGLERKAANVKFSEFVGFLRRQHDVGIDQVLNDDITGFVDPPGKVIDSDAALENSGKDEEVSDVVSDEDVLPDHTPDP